MFNHIGGLNAILDRILNSPPPPPSPSPPPGGAGSGFGFGSNSGPPSFGQRRLGPDSPTLQPVRFSPGGIPPNNGSNFGSDSESDLSLGGPPGLGLNMPGTNFSNGNPYQQPQVPQNGRPPFGGRKTRRKRRNKKSKKGGRKSMHKRTRSKK